MLLMGETIDTFYPTKFLFNTDYSSLHKIRNFHSSLYPSKLSIDKKKKK